MKTQRPQNLRFDNYKLVDHLLTYAFWYVLKLSSAAMVSMRACTPAHLLQRAETPITVAWAVLLVTAGVQNNPILLLSHHPVWWCCLFGDLSWNTHPTSTQLMWFLLDPSCLLIPWHLPCFQSSQSVLIIQVMILNSLAEYHLYLHLHHCYFICFFLLVLLVFFLQYDSVWLPSPSLIAIVACLILSWLCSCQSVMPYCYSLYYQISRQFHWMFVQYMFAANFFLSFTYTKTCIPLFMANTWW